MRTNKHEDRGFWILLALALAAFYLGFAILDGYHIYPDSTSYITMDGSRCIPCFWRWSGGCSPRRARRAGCRRPP